MVAWIWNRKYLHVSEIVMMFRGNLCFGLLGGVRTDLEQKVYTSKIRLRVTPTLPVGLNNTA